MMVAALLLLVACGSSPFVLLNSLAEGRRITYTTEKTSDISIEVMGMTQGQKETERQTQEFFVKEVQPDGDRVMQYKITAIKTDSKDGKETSSYDSQNPDAATDADVAKVLGALIDHPFQVTVSPKGEVSDVKGADEFIDKVVSASGFDANSEVGKLLVQAIESEYGDVGLTNTLAVFFEHLPEDSKTLKVGSTWSNTRTETVLMPMQSTTTYTLNRFEGDNAVFDVSGTISATGQVELQEDMEVEADLNGTRTGTVIVDKKSGWIVSSTQEQSISGSMSAQGMTLPIKAKTKSTIMRD